MKPDSALVSELRPYTVPLPSNQFVGQLFDPEPSKRQGRGQGSLDTPPRGSHRALAANAQAQGVLVP